MRTIRLRQSLPPDEADRFEGTTLDADAAKVVLSNEDVTVLSPEGLVVCILRHNVLPPSQCEVAYANLREAAVKTTNRGVAAGQLDYYFKGDDEQYPHQQENATHYVDRRAMGKRTRLRYRPIKRDGTLSKTNYAKIVQSGVVGYLERSARFPFCRQTVWTMENFEKFRLAIPYIRSIAAVYAETASLYYRRQSKYVERIHSDFKIADTPFTTVTVNRDWQTAVHKDAKDYRGGLGVLTAFKAGDFDGCYFTFPRYGLGVNIQTGDVLLANVHDWHGNTPFIPRSVLYERVSLVLYARENMITCKSAPEELERAKHRHTGEKMIDVPPLFTE